MTQEEKRLKWRKLHQERKSDPEYIKRKNSWGRRLKDKPFARLAYFSNNWYKNGRISAFDLWKIARKQKLKCALSGEKLTNENMSIDHIVSKSKGGLNIPSNVRLVLKPINTARQTMTDKEFIELCKKVVRHSNLSSVL
jgi:5-methylcytosine-specific restriction endonuclease McrA